jgi:serine/threonine protein kinase
LHGINFAVHQRMSQPPNSNNAPMDAALAHLESGFLVGNGRFTLIRLIGRGGMGVVWLARDESLREDVALKFLPPEIRFDAVALDDLRRETARARKLTHPNIIRIHDLYKDDREAFISMEFVDGPNLGDLRLGREQQVFEWEFLRPLIRQLCEGLDYAHSEKVVHRDLKPANMMLDSRGRLKLSDFGIAAQVSDSVSRVSMIRHGQSGTITYMSPQQMDGKLPQITDDIYALGATLYELLTGRPPFFTGDIGYQVRHLPPPSMEERMAELGVDNPVPASLAALIMACLRKEPEQRPVSARAVVDWIEMPPPAEIVAPAAPRASTPAPFIAPPVAPVAHSFAPQPEVEQSAFEEPILMTEPEADAQPAPEHRSGPRGTLVFVTGALVITLLSALVVVKLVRDSRRHGREAARSVITETSLANSTTTSPLSVGSAPPATAGRWTTIFNGTSLDAWRGWDAKSWIGSWSISDQSLQSLPNGTVHLTTRDQFGDFELEFEWKVAAGANSGILYRALPGPGEIWDTAPEYQIMDDALDRSGRASKTSTGSLYGLIAPKNKSLRLNGEFNSGRIVMRGSQVEHWLNGVKVLEADLSQPETRRGMPPKFDQAKWGLAPRGHIVLQHYGGEASFRNIRVRRLDGN